MLSIHTREVGREIIKEAFYNEDACKEHSCRIIWLAQDSGVEDFEVTLMIRLYKEKFCDFDGGAFARPLNKREVFNQVFELEQKDKNSWYAWPKTKGVTAEDVGWSYVVSRGMFPDKETAYKDEDGHTSYEEYFDPTEIDEGDVQEAIYSNFEGLDIEFFNS